MSTTQSAKALSTALSVIPNLLAQLGRAADDLEHVALMAKAAVRNQSSVSGNDFAAPQEMLEGKWSAIEVTDWYTHCILVDEKWNLTSAAYRLRVNRTTIRRWAQRIRPDMYKNGSGNA